MSATVSPLETAGAALTRGRAALRGAGIDSYALDARLLLATALDAAPARLIADPDQVVAPDVAGRYEALLRRRLAREPMAHILGRREFWSLDFAVTPDTLTPRPDSETVVATVLQIAGSGDRPLRILDLGTGTGCLLLALLHELPGATGVGVDCSLAALALALRNAQALGLASRVRFHAGNWGQGLAGRFDIVVSNPPYIVSADLPNLSPEVGHEPRLALDGGADGLDAYRALAPDLPRLLEPAGLAVLEIGDGQAPAVEETLRAAGLVPVDRRLDLAGIERCIVARSAPYDG